MKKLANHIILSGVTVSMLFSPLMALPSGGKFTHGTSGSISIDKTNPNKPIMNVSGNGANSVIQWGGGFNIANGEKVNFGNNNFKGQQNYLNIAHGTNKSTIAGILEAGNNNVFLINPNGVIITKTGNINANRFVASTSSMDSKSMQEFADGKLAYNTFSPVFKPNGGNVVNMGSINAKNVTLQGNTVMLSADTSWDDKNNKIKLNQIKADSIDLKGNEVYVDISTINSKNLTTEAKNKGIAYLSATGYYYNPTRKYDEFNNVKLKKTYNQYISIGSDLDWWHFAKGWNEKEAFRNTASEYRLTNNIDFKASSGQNYANYWIDLNGDGKKDANEFTNMIVGFKDDSAFTKTFDGQGYTLKNINIDTTILDNKPIYVGLFGKANGANFKNINVDYMGGGLKLSNAVHSGGFVAYSRDSSFSNISLNNINHINHENNAHTMIGGFVGVTFDSLFSNISLNDIGNINNIGIDGVAIGGFVGIGQSSSFSNISLSNIESIKNINGDGVNIGGFVGIGQSSLFSNISLSNIGDISGIGNFVSVGGFVGRNDLGGKYSKIYISGIKNISSEGAYDNGIYAGGFVGYLGNSFNTDHREFSDITVKNIGNIVSANNFEKAYAYSGGFAGFLQEGYFERISLENINSISSIASSSNSDSRAYSGGFAGGNNRVDKSTYNINNISLKGIKNITSEAKSAYAGGFAGQLTNNYSGNSSSINFLKNIYIEGIDHIKANSGVGAYAGGFAGSLDYVDIDNVELNNIKEIKAEAFSKEYSLTSAGGFVGIAERYLNFENIVLNNFGSISANGSYPVNNHAGGFVGYGYNWDPEIPIIFNNISLNNFGSISAKNSAGGFVGYDRGIEMSNISLNNIHYIQGASAGGFAGHSESSYENIVLNNIKHIKGVYAGGFTGSGRGGKNIYMYFDKGAIIEGSESSGKFFGHLNEQFIPDTENTYIYYHKDDLTNANIDQKYWELYKWIELRPYDDNSQGYIDFKTAALAALNGLKEIDCGAGKKCLVFTKDFEIEKPSNPNISEPNYPNNVVVSKPSQNTDYIPSTEDIINEIATLDQGDLISNDIWDYIINDIDKVNYNIDIRLLAKLLSEYSNISNKTEDEQVKFITTYLGVKENDARALLQSLSFLNTYKDHDINKAKFTNETVKTNFANSFKNAEAKFTKFNNKKNKLYNNLNDLNKNIVSKGFYLEYLLEVNQEQLAKAIKAYNDYIVLIEKGLKNENDPAFISIKNTIIKLNNEAKNLYVQLLDYKDQLQDFKDNNEFKKVIIAGDFKTIPLLITPDVNKPINGGGEDGDYEKISRQIADSQKQTPTFEYEEEETEEVDETSLLQKSKTCIVSDNYKTMNPCIVGGL